jgi:hypothetical protein
VTERARTSTRADRNFDSDLCIVSGGSHLRLPSPINHKVYAAMHGADYRLECGPIGKLKSRFYFKLDVLVRLLPRYDWVLWIDDDAFFTSPATDVRDVCRRQPPEVMLSLADGRVKAGGAWTYINSGVLLARSCIESIDFLRRCLETDTTTVRAWWNAEVHGMFTHSDQDTILYHMLHSPDQWRFSIVPHLTLNAREYHYSERLDEHFICHFAGLPNKLHAIREFGQRFGVGPTLLSGAALRAHGFDDDIGDEFILLGDRTFSWKVRRRVRRALSRLAVP